MLKYEVQVLNDKEFDSLPYEGLSDSLGFADVKKGMAFVRSSGSKEFDLGTIAHEVNHLIEKHGKNHPDWESGILHKKGGVMRSIVPALLAFIPGIGPALSAASAVGMDQYAKSGHPEQLGEPGKVGDILTTGALAYGGAKLGQSSSGFKAGVEGSKAAGGGILGQTLSGAKGMVIGTPATMGGKSISVINPAAAAATPGFVPATAGILGSAGSLMGTNVNPYIAKPLTSAAPGINTTPNPLTGTMSPEAAMSLKGGGVGDVAGNPVAPMNLLGNTPAAGPTSSIITNPAIPPVESTGTLMSKASDFLSKPSNLLGVASLGGSMLPQTSQFQMPDSVEQLRSKIMEGQGVSPLGQQAQMELLNILKSTPQELYAPNKDAYYQATLRRTEDAYARAQEQLDATYNQAGVYGSGEHLAAKDKLNQQLTNAKTDLYAVTEQRNFELARTEKYQAIQDSLGVDKNTMDDLLGLTGMDVQQAANVYNAKAADIQAIREALGTIGAELLARGQSPANLGSGLTINMGGGTFGG